MLGIHRPLFPLDRAIEVIAGVNLNSWLISENLHRDTPQGVFKHRDLARNSVWFPVAHYAVVINTTGVGVIARSRESLN